MNKIELRVKRRFTVEAIANGIYAISVFAVLVVIVIMLIAVTAIRFL